MLRNSLKYCKYVRACAFCWAMCQKCSVLEMLMYIICTYEIITDKQSANTLYNILKKYKITHTLMHLLPYLPIASDNASKRHTSAESEDIPNRSEHILKASRRSRLTPTSDSNHLI